MQLLLLGCSYNTDFYIINETNSSITVEYKVSDFSKSGPFVKGAYITKLNSDFKKIDENSTEKVIVDSKNKTVKATLESGESLWFGAELNFSLTNSSHIEILMDKIKFLKINIEEGVLYANRSNIVTSLTKFNNYSIGIRVK